MKSFIRYLSFSILIALVSCDESVDQEVLDYGEDYFPLTSGWYAIYDVEAISYSAISPPETRLYELKTEVVDSFQNNAGGYTYVLYNSSRASGNEEWQYVETLTVRISDNEVVVTEESTPFVKLLFPAAPQSVWNGNSRNNMGVDEYRIISFDQPVTINGMEFEKTLSVEQEMYDDEVTRTDERTEVYARGVGLISRDSRKLVYCTEEICINDKIIESGIIFTQRIKEYGVR